MRAAGRPRLHAWQGRVNSAGNSWSALIFMARLCRRQLCVRRARRAGRAQELVTAHASKAAKAHTRSGTNCWSPKQARLVSARLNLAGPRAVKGAGAFYRLSPDISGGHHLRPHPPGPAASLPRPPGALRRPHTAPPKQQLPPHMQASSLETGRPLPACSVHPHIMTARGVL